MFKHSDSDATTKCVSLTRSQSSAPSNLSCQAVSKILGVKFPVPLTPRKMAESLRVAFYPNISTSEKLKQFLKRLEASLVSSGASVISYERALAEGVDGRIGKGIVLIAPGEGEVGNLAIDHVASLAHNTVLGVIDGTLPGLWANSLQRRVDALVSGLVWHMAHILIYVDDTTWTICNMNGAIDTFALESMDDRVINSLVPKLAAPVIPPQKGDFDLQQNAFDPLLAEYEADVADLLSGAKAWRKTGLLISQTRIDELVFRNSKYRRIASAFLSWRTGMSYGFLARQLPVSVKPAIDLEDAPRILRMLDWSEKDYIELDGQLCVGLRLLTKRFLVRVPDVTVLCTRSGCEKTCLEPTKDLIKLRLSKGKVIVETPKGLGTESDCQPSFDTSTILAHAIGNAIVASVLERLLPTAGFAHALKRDGLALAHWHGFLPMSELPKGYYLYGDSNPPVSCSTPQAAIYALTGKLSAFERSLDENVEFVSDAHVEPSHGTNVTGTSLTSLAELVARAVL